MPIAVTAMSTLARNQPTRVFIPELLRTLEWPVLYQALQQKQRFSEALLTHGSIYFALSPHKKRMLRVRAVYGNAPELVRWTTLRALRLTGDLDRQASRPRRPALLRDAFSHYAGALPEREQHGD
jgi:hypothetical protein